MVMNWLKQISDTSIGGAVKSLTLAGIVVADRNSRPSASIVSVDRTATVGVEAPIICSLKQAADEFHSSLFSIMGLKMGSSQIFMYLFFTGAL